MAIYRLVKCSYKIYFSINTKAFQSYISQFELFLVKEKKIRKYYTLEKLKLKNAYRMHKNGTEVHLEIRESEFAKQNMK